MESLAGGFRLGDCEIRPTEGTVSAPGSVTKLGPRPMELLVFLAAEPGRVFSRAELMKNVWSSVVVADETLSRCISDLRQALGDDPRAPRYIETLSRRGYRLLLPPTPLEDHGSYVANQAGARPAYRAWLLAPMALALLTGAWMLTGGGDDHAAERAAQLAEAPLAPNGLAVLPFVNMSDSPEMEYFSDGLSEELLNRLASVEELAVVARTSAFAFKHTNRDVREIGRQLGVSYVLEGSVRRDADRLRITAQLIDVRTGFHLFSEIYERSLADVFAVQEEVAFEVGEALESRLTGMSGAVQPRASETVPEAFEAYLLGKHLQRKLTPEHLQRSVDAFRQAVSIDPGFARAHAELASTLALWAFYSAQPIESLRQEIEALIERALELNPRSSEAWHARGNVAHVMWRAEDAVQAFTKAHELNPNYAGTIGMLGRTLYMMGRNREAIAYTRRALEKDPLSLGLIHNHAAILGQLGEFEESERWLRRAMEIEPDRPDLNTLWAMAGTKYLAGEHGEAVRWFRDGIERGNPHGAVRTQLGWALLELGEIDESRRWIDDGLSRTPDPLIQLDSLLAWHAFQGDFDGLAETVRSYEQRFPDHPKMPALRAFAALHRGDAETAIKEYRSLAQRDPERLHYYWDMYFGHWHAPYLARAEQLAGQREAAELTLAEMERRLAAFERNSGMPGISAYYRAVLASLRGSHEAALDHLDRARRAGWRRHGQVRHSPLFAAVQQHPRLEEVLARVQQDLRSPRLAGKR